MSIPQLSIFQHRQYARFALCRFLCTLGWQMVGVAIGWQVYALTHDALMLGIVGLCEFVPFVTLVMVGGHVADRADRRHVLMITWSIEAICMLALAVVTLAGVRQAWPILLAIAIFGTTRAFWAPTTQATISNLVPREILPRALAVSSTLFQIAVISGPALGGLLFLLGPAVVFGACTLLFAVAIGLVASIAPTHFRAPQDPRHEISGLELLEGVRFVLRQRLLFGTMSLDLFAVLFGGATALLPIYASDVLHVGPVGLGFLRTAPGVGAAVIAMGLMVKPVERRAGVVMFGGVAAFGIATLVFGLSRNFALSLAALFVLGCGDMMSVYVRGVLVQLNTPDAIRGRVSAITSMFIGASNELGEFESGITARWFGTVRAVLLGGVLTLAVVAIWIGIFPELRRLDRLR